MFKVEVSKLFDRPERNYKVIDGIRAIAILWVIIFHIWLFHIASFPETCAAITQFPFMVWITKGDLGVDLFFVISGFLIGTILFREYKKTVTLRIKRFYARRFLRLMPAYFVCMIGGALFSSGTPLVNWPMGWANLLYINNYVPDSYMPWTWSLAIEEQFYLVIPFLILVVFPRLKNMGLLFLLLMIVPIVLKFYYTTFVHGYSMPFDSVFLNEKWDNWFWNYYVLTHFRYGGLLAGIALAYLHVYQREKLQRFFTEKKALVSNITILGLIAVISVSSISLGQWTNLENSIFHSIPRLLGNAYEAIHRELFYYSVAFIILACLYSEVKVIGPIKRFLSLRFFYPIAQVSYSAYLFHEMFMYLYFPQAKIWFANTGLPEWTVMIINGIVSLVVIQLVASVMFLFIEQPFQRLKEKWA